MRLADWGLAVSLLLVVAVLVAAALVGRARRSTPAVRRSVWRGAALAAGLLLAQTAVAHSAVDRGVLAAADGPVLSWFVTHRAGWATGLSVVLALVTGPAAMTVLTTLAVAVLLRRGERRRALLVVAVGIGATVLGNGFKQLYARARPPVADQVIVYTNYALPSGHALGTIVVLGVLTAVVLPSVHSRGGRVALVVSVTLGVLAVGASRLYLGAHWLTDVLTAWLLGGAWLTVGVTALVVLRHQLTPDECHSHR